MVEPFTVGQMLSAQARLQPERIGARDLEREMSFRQWNTRACRLANALLGLGLDKGDRVAVLAYNRVEWAEIYAAVCKAGLVAVPINFRLTGREAAYIIEDAGAAVLLVEDVLLDLVDGIGEALPVPPDRRVCIGSDPGRDGYRRYEGLIDDAADSEPEAAVTADDPWCLMYTSGTTGQPKGVIRCHRDMAMVALMTQVELALQRRDHALLVMPMCHANSLNFFTAFVHCGGAVTIFSRRSFDPALCLRTLASSGATFSSLVPTHFSMMLEVPESERGVGQFDRVEKLMISSAPAHADTKRTIMEMFPNSGLFELYGSSEAGWVTMLHPHEQFDKLGTVGREVVGSLPIRLLDDDGREVPDGQPGELFSCGPYCFQGYWNKPDKTAEAFRGDYLSVGDIALRDADGYIRLVDRKKNMIITGGENVYPAEVEAALAGHPDVRDVAVIGQADRKWGERVLAVVVVRGGSDVTEADLLAWSRERLAGYKCPRKVVFVSADEIPRTATGKIQHHVLKQMLAGREDAGA